VPLDQIIKSSNIIKSKNQSLINKYTANPRSKSISNIVKFLIENFSINITSDQDIINGYNHDWSNMEGFADALCRPLDTMQCSIVMSLCYKLNIKMTISAGRTNLTGSATPNGGIIISVIDMDDIGPIDQKKNNIKCSPGVYLEELRNNVNSKSNNTLEFPVDPTSRKEAMVGGAISCNASGFIPGKKGAMRYWVDGLEFLLPNGELIYINRNQYFSKNGEFFIENSDNKKITLTIPSYERVDLKNASGPYSSNNGVMDIIDLIIGSEGIFGCIVSATLKLDKKPTDYLNLFIKLKTEYEAFSLYSYTSDFLNGEMSLLRGFEYFGENCSKYMKNKEYFFDKNYQVAIYIQIPIYNEEIDSVIEKWYQMLMKCEFINEDEQILSLNDSTSWKTFFDARHSIPANALQKSKKYMTSSIITDTIVPPSSFKKFINDTHKLIRKKNIEYLLFGHLGDCHLHFHLIPNKQNEDNALECYHKIIELSSYYGGVYSAEHGTGKRKKKDFIDCYGMTAVNQIIKCKESFDPKFLLNIGNVIDK
tara:strand:+ start:532 stop:2139 length:1608 start_codon:yes stop_codon:yes gene_type:complete